MSTLPARSACQVIVELQPNDGAWNMAVDEVLLDAAVAGDRCTLRFYRWSRATVSLGYFQRDVSAATLSQWAELPMVRRLSGGGAILHEYEWTYSLTLSAEHALAAEPQQLYGRVHRRFVEVLTSRGIVARLRGDGGESDAGAFLCFGRGDSRDVVCDGHKILGSAQRRRRGAVLQHGSLLLRRSQHAPQFPGIEDLVHNTLEEQVLVEELAANLSDMLGDDVPRAGLSADERRRAAVLSRDRYHGVSWGRRPCRANEPSV